ncbi:MAG: hypothetical protein ABIL58_14230 [Pseudomonadota bacterium]
MKLFRRWWTWFILFIMFSLVFIHIDMQYLAERTPTEGYFRLLIAATNELSGLLGLLVLVFSGAMAAANHGAIRRFFRSGVYRIGGAFNQSVDAIVIPLSENQKNFLPEWLINRTRPKMVRFLVSKESQLQIDRVARNLTPEAHAGLEYRPRPTEGNDVEDVDIVKFEEMASCKKRAREYLKKLLKIYPSQRIFVDISGGRVTTSLALFQAAEEEGVSTIYAYKEGGGFITLEDVQNSKACAIVYISDWT